MRQIITVDPSSLTIEPNSPFSFDVSYSTADPVDETLTGLGLRLHYNSSEITFNELSNVLETDLIAQQAQEDTDNFDSDPDTDQFILVSWSDPFGGEWPGEGVTPVTLYTANFDALDAGTTAINFTASSTASGYDLDASPVTVEIETPPETDTTPPTVMIENVPDTLDSLNPFVVTFEFSEAVTGFEVGDIAVTNGSASNFTAVDGNTYTAEITPNAEGEVAIAIPAGVATDAAGNANVVAETATVTVTLPPTDTTPPTVMIENVPDTLDSLNPFVVTFEFSEAVTGFEVGDIAVTNGSASNFNAVDGNTYTAEITPNAEGELTITIAADAFTDEAGNSNTTSVTTTTTVTVAPPPVENQPPTLDPITVEGLEDQDVNFTLENFTSAFSDDDEGDELQSIRVITLPGAGSLTLNGEAVTDAPISANDLGNLRYSPNPDVNGTDTFTVRATDGEAESDPAEVAVEIAAVNDPPTFTLIENPNQVITTGETVSVPNFATNISPGPADEADQTLTFNLETTGDAIFATAPTLDPATGTLSYTLADTTGTATVNVSLSDDGGTENGGVDTSETATFTVESIVGVGEVATVFTQIESTSFVNALAYDATSVPTGETAITRLAQDVQELGTDAEFDNLVGLYPVVNVEGDIDTDGDGVADLSPGDPGYARAAITSREENFRILAGADGDPDFNTTVEEFGDVLLNGGRLYAPFVIANAGDIGFEEFVTREDAEDSEFNNPATFREDLVAYFTFIGANPDNVAHLENRGNGVFGFEDLPSNLGISDNDFNDAVFELTFTSAAV